MVAAVSKLFATPNFHPDLSSLQVYNFEKAKAPKGGTTDYRKHEPDDQQIMNPLLLQPWQSK